jgi:hypothetical protein
LSQILILFIKKITEDIVENEVTVWLFGKDKGLNELSVWCRFVRDFSDDLYDDILEGSLRIDIEYPNFAVLDVESLYSVADCLGTVSFVVIAC